MGGSPLASCDGCDEGYDTGEDPESVEHMVSMFAAALGYMPCGAERIYLEDLIVVGGFDPSEFLSAPRGTVVRLLARWRVQWHGDEELPTRSCILAREAMAGIGWVARPLFGSDGGSLSEVGSCGSDDEQRWMGGEGGCGGVGMSVGMPARGSSGGGDGDSGNGDRRRQ